MMKTFVKFLLRVWWYTLSAGELFVLFGVAFCILHDATQVHNPGTNDIIMLAFWGSAAVVGLIFQFRHQEL